MFHFKSYVTISLHTTLQRYCHLITTFIMDDLVQENNAAHMWVNSPVNSPNVSEQEVCSFLLLLDLLISS